jgi:predicted ATPase/DNA-binding SARP family transcriptional activator
MNASLQIFTFGGVRIFLNGIQLTEFPTRKVEALLVFLACTTQPYSRQQLAELLWDERSENQSLTNLRATLSRLKQQLEPFLLISRHTIALRWDADIWVDSVEMLKYLNNIDEHPSADQINHMEQAAALYQGDFLAGFYINESVGFENWLTGRKEYLRARILAALIQLVKLALERGDTEKGITHVLRALQLDPLREEAYQLYMLLLARTGQRAKALEQYHLCQALFKRELNMTPDAKTTELYEQILSGKINVTSERRVSHLPAQTTPFVGRAAELTQIQRSLDSAECRLLSLIGMGGVGKTRLAYQTAQNNLYTFADGVWFISLVGLTSAQFLASSIASSLGLTLDASTNVRDSLFAFLSTRHLLLVMDNFEHLLDGAGEAALLLGDILAHAPRVKILVTSRERLNLYEEWFFQVQGLSYPEHFDPQFERYGAVQLFIQGAQRVQPQFSAQDHTESVLKICQLVEGLPLALELSTYWLKIMSCEQLANELDKNITLLSSSFRNFPERHSSIQLIFEYSWQHLSAEEQEILTKLSVFHGSFDAQAVQKVAQATFPELNSLHTASLIRFDAEHNRYSIHELIRRLSEDRLQAREATHRAHLEYYVQFSAQAEERLMGAHESEWHEKIDLELDNIRAALAWAYEHKLRMEILLLAVQLYRFWRIRSYLAEGYQWIERGLDQTTPIEGNLHAKTLGRMAALSNLMGKYDQTIAYYQQALSLARKQGNPERQAATLNGLGVVASQRQDYQLARTYYQECLDICRAHNIPRLLCVGLLNLSVGYHEEGDYAQARTLLFEALALARELGNPQNIADVLNNLSGVAYEQEDYGLATQYLEESLALYQKLKNTVNIITILHVFVNIYIVQGDLVKARETTDTMQALSEMVDDQIIKALCAYTLGFVSLEEGAIDQAETHLIQAVARYDKLDDKRMLVFCLIECARAAAKREQYDKAIHLLSYTRALLTSLRIMLPVQTDRKFAALRTLLKESCPDEFITLWQQGEQLSRAEVIASATMYVVV